MADTAYSIQTVGLPVGSVEVKLESPDASLTVPSRPSLILSGDFTERLDVLPGQCEFENVEFEYVEDYSVHAEGFWYRVLTADHAYIKVLVGGGAIFYGKVLPQGINNAEKSLIVGALYRTGTIQCVSFLSLLRETLTVDVEVALRSLCISAVTIDGVAESLVTFLPVKAIFSQAIATGTGETYSLDATTVFSSDIQFGDIDDNWYNMEDLYVGGYQASVWYNNFNATGAWLSRYPNILDLIVAIGRCFGQVIRYNYDEASSYHYLQLRTRGRSYATSYTCGISKESNQIISADSELAQIEVTYQSPRYGASTDRYFYAGYPVFQAVSAEPPGWNPQFTLVPEVRDTLLSSEVRDGMTLYYHHVDDPLDIDDMVTMQRARYWDYSTGAWSGGSDMQTVIAAYYATRFGGKKRVYERLYPSVYTDLGFLQNHAINDGVASKDFYATEIRRNLKDNTTWVRWQEV